MYHVDTYTAFPSMAGLSLVTDEWKEISGMLRQPSYLGLFAVVLLSLVGRKLYESVIPL